MEFVKMINEERERNIKLFYDTLNEKTMEIQRCGFELKHFIVRTRDNTIVVVCEDIKGHRREFDIFTWNFEYKEE